MKKNKSNPLPKPIAQFFAAAIVQGEFAAAATVKTYYLAISYFLI